MPVNKGDNFIHVKLDYEEVSKSRKEILSSEMDLVNIMKSLGRYGFLRQKELELKEQFYKEIKKIIIGLKLLESSWPHIKVPKNLLPEVEKSKPEEKRVFSQTEDGLEEQLRDIQRKLREMY